MTDSQHCQRLQRQGSISQQDHWQCSRSNSGGSIGGRSPSPRRLQNLLPDTILGLQTTPKSTATGASPDPLAGGKGLAASLPKTPLSFGLRRPPRPQPNPLDPLL